jgi:hypothetical protein
MLSYEDSFAEPLRVLDEIASVPWPDGLPEAEAELFPDFIGAVVLVAEDAGVDVDVLAVMDALGHDLERDRQLEQGRAAVVR